MLHTKTLPLSGYLSCTIYSTRHCPAYAGHFITRQMFNSFFKQRQTNGAVLCKQTNGALLAILSLCCAQTLANDRGYANVTKAESHAAHAAQYKYRRYMSTKAASKACCAANNGPGGDVAQTLAVAAHTNTLLNFGESLKMMLPKYIKQFVYSNSENAYTLTVKNAAYIKPVLVFLRDHTSCLFKVLIDVCGVDYPEREHRFDVVYHLVSVKYNARIRVKISVDELTPVPSITQIYPAANWLEREVWDMYGVYFADHPDLRRILTDYGFEGHPLRKEFPLSGYVEVRYDEAQKRVITEPVEITQEYRTFDFSSPWEKLS
jgi:NADH/F420H2 dehydrogenase subunit C